MKPEDLPLRDLHLPAEIGWWPLAYGWWILIGLLVMTAAYLGHRLWLRWQAGAARRRAILELKQLQLRFAEDHDATAFIVAASILLRRAMLAYAPRNQVAGLSGEAWLNWLDRGLGEPSFSAGPGRCLHDLPYRPPGSISSLDVDQLASLLRRRLQTPLQGPL